MPDTITIHNDQLRVVLSPEKGAGMLAFQACRSGEWVDISPDARDPRHGLTWCNWMMVPYSNRIENGTFTFAGERYTLENGETHAIHGDARNHPWSVQDQSETYLRCDLKSEMLPAFNWPWPIEVRGEYEIMENVFSMRLALANRGDTPMPAGFGWHPYFMRWLTRQGEPAHMCMDVHAVYPDANDNRIPSGPAQPPAAHVDFRRETVVEPDNFFDCCCTGYDGKGLIRWPESGVELTFRCTPNLSHLVLYNPGDKEYFAAEPVTNANNGVNLLAAGDPTSGVEILQPGESMDARFDLIVTLP